MLDLEIIKELGGKIIGDLDISKVKDIHNVFQEITENSLFIVLKGTKVDGSVYVNKAIERGAIGIITSVEMDVSVPQIFVDNTFNFVIRYAERVRKKFHKPVIAVLGSAGKTTLRHVLISLLPGKKSYTRKSFNVKFSVAMSMMMLNPEDSCAIIEIGTNFPGEIEDICRFVNPDYSLISNIGVEHAEFFTGIKKIIQEEYSCLYFTNKAVISASDNHNLIIENNLDHLITTEPMHYFCPRYEKTGNKISFKIDKEIIEFETDKTNKGIINAIVMCLFLAKKMECDIEEVIENIEYLTNVSHRNNIITISDLVIHDCSYNSNPLSFQNLLDSIEGSCLLVFGEMKELGNLTEEEHLKALNNIYNHPMIKKAYVVGKVNIPEDFSDKIVPYTEHSKDEFSGLMYFQGSRSLKLENIIFELIEDRFTKIKTSLDV